MKNFIFTALGVGINALEKSEKWIAKSGLDFVWNRIVPYSFLFYGSGYLFGIGSGSKC
jgi:hypothetical protein